MIPEGAIGDFGGMQVLRSRHVPRGQVYIFNRGQIVAAFDGIAQPPRPSWWRRVLSWFGSRGEAVWWPR